MSRLCLLLRRCRRWCAGGVFLGELARVESEKRATRDHEEEEREERSVRTLTPPATLAISKSRVGYSRGDITCRGSFPLPLLPLIPSQRLALQDGRFLLKTLQRHSNGREVLSPISLNSTHPNRSFFTTTSPLTIPFQPARPSFHSLPCHLFFDKSS